MSGGRRDVWDWFTEMNIVQFLNYLAFLKDKTREENEQIKKANG